MKKSKLNFPKDTIVIISGNTLTPTQVETLKAYPGELPISRWYSEKTGQVGYIDGLSLSLEEWEFYKIFSEYANKFPFLNLGITVMSGKKGSFVQPLVSYRVVNGSLKYGECVHTTHSAPRRIT